MNALLEDGRGGDKTQITPNTAAKVRKLANKGKNAPQIQSEIKALRADAGDERKTPAIRTIQSELADQGGKYTRQWRGGFMVKTPWHARWRHQFASEWHSVLTAPAPNRQVRLEWILFTDEKKFCLFDSRFGRWIFDDSELNIPRAHAWTDEEYMAWKAEVGKPLPFKKQRGLYPWFVWGGVGHNMKTNLYFLEKGEKLTAPLFLRILDQELLPRRQQFVNGMPGGDHCRRPLLPTDEYPRDARVPYLVVTLDNDSKHYNDESRAKLAAAGIRIMGSFRKKADGTHPDRAPGRGGHMVDYPHRQFPCYTPDGNGAIEKVWREHGQRVLDRAKEIHNRADMKRIIIEEWEGLEFERKERWCGINHLVARTIPCLAEMKENGGWDTSYMKS